MSQDDLQICRQNFLEDILQTLRNLRNFSFNPEVSFNKNLLLYQLTGNNKIVDNIVFKYNDEANQFLYAKMDKDGGFAFNPLTTSVQWTELIKPMVELNNNLDVIKNYEKIKLGDRILIWQTLDKDPTDPGHLSCVIDCKSGEKYSFGLGTNSSKKVEPKSLLREGLSNIPLGDLTTLTEGLILSPDPIFLHKLTDQLNKPDKTYIRLVASAEINETSIALIRKEFDQINYENDLFVALNVQITNSPLLLSTDEEIKNKELAINETLNQFETAQGLLEPLEYEFYKILILETKQKLLSGKNILLSFYYQLTIRNCAYTKLAGTKTRSINCTSFLQKLFEGLLSCSYDYIPLSDYFVSIPKNCRQITKIATCRSKQAQDESPEFFTPMSRQPSESPELLFKFVSPKRKPKSPKQRKAKSPKRKSKSPKRKPKSPKQRKAKSPKIKPKSPKQRKAKSPKRKSKSPKRKSKSPKQRKAKSPKRNSTKIKIYNN